MEVHETSAGSSKGSNKEFNFGSCPVVSISDNTSDGSSNSISAQSHSFSLTSSSSTTEESKFAGFCDFDDNNYVFTDDLGHVANPEETPRSSNSVISIPHLLLLVL